MLSKSFWIHNSECSSWRRNTHSSPAPLPETRRQAAEREHYYYALYKHKRTYRDISSPSVEVEWVTWECSIFAWFIGNIDIVIITLKLKKVSKYYEQLSTKTYIKIFNCQPHSLPHRGHQSPLLAAVTVAAPAAIPSCVTIKCTSTTQNLKQSSLLCVVTILRSTIKTKKFLAPSG